MNQRLTDYRVFWREFRRAFYTTGAVLPSGAGLAKALARYVREDRHVAESLRDSELAVSDFGELSQVEKLPYVGRRILEVGPGTGAVTQAVVRAMRDGDQLELVEKNGEFVSLLREKFASDPVYQPAAGRFVLHHAGVDELSEERPFDVIVSGLPLNNFPVAVVESILEKLNRLLAPGGVLSFFEYVAIRQMKATLSRQADRERLRGIGSALDRFLSGREIRRECVLANVPPAWVHHVRK